MVTLPQIQNYKKSLVLKNRFRKYLPVVVDIETGGFDPEKNASVIRNNIKKTPFHKFSVIDTVSLGVLATGQTVLARICEHLSVNYDNDKAHSAAYDTGVTAEVFCKIINSFDN